MPKKKSEHYVNNKELLESLIVYRSKVDKAAQKYFEKYDKHPPKSGAWEGKPRIPDYLGECFLKILNGCATITEPHNHSVLPVPLRPFPTVPPR
jgi:hypothetical protein